MRNRKDLIATRESPAIDSHVGEPDEPPLKQGVKLTFFTGSHLVPKYFKLVANSKKLVVKIHTSYKEDTRVGHIQRERLPKSKMASSDDRFTFRNRACAGIW